MHEFFNGRTGHPKLEELRKFKYAHRGFHDKPQIPENSLAAFIRAIRNKFGAELDVHLTKDGKLVVFHDDTTDRCTGQPGTIEERTLEEVRALRLEGTDEKIPLFNEVLTLFEDSGYPLIIELKVVGGNYNELAKAVCERLDSYKGLFCIESFDPRAIKAVRLLRPEIVRGQLASDFVRDPGTSPKNTRWLLTNLKLDFLSKPDFVAYNFEYHDNPAFRKAVRRGIQGVAWTIRTPKDYKEAERLGYINIFERFDPNEQEL